MSYLDFDFPHTRFFESDLRELIKQVFIMNDLVTNFVSINAIKYADPIQWDITKSYEKNTVVIDGNSGVAYISVRPVPAGISLTRGQYWTKVFDLSIFITKGAANFANTYEADPTTTATQATSKDNWVVWDATLYQALTDIHPGDRYVPGGNIRRMTVEDFYNILKSIIDNETHEREAGDDALEIALNEETELRTEGDSALHNEIVAESVARENADNDLQDNIDNEESARIEAINNVNTEIAATNNKIGDLSALNTDDKSNVVNAINEVSNKALNLANVINVKDYGAVGDGITDDYNAINTALSEAIRTGKPLYFPKGIFYTATTVIIPQCDGLTIMGSGRNCSTVKGNCVFKTEDSVLTDHMTICNLTFKSMPGSNLPILDFTGHFYRSIIFNCAFYEWYTAIHIWYYLDSKIMCCEFNNPLQVADSCIIVSRNANGSSGANLTIAYCLLQGWQNEDDDKIYGKVGIEIRDGDAVYLDNVDIGRFIYNNVKISAQYRSDNHNFHNCYFDVTKREHELLITGTAQMQHICINNCWFASAGYIDGTNAAGVYCNARGIEDVHINDNRFINIAGSGIHILSDHYIGVIDNNEFTNIGIGNIPNNNYGIYLETPSTVANAAVVKNNYIYNCTGHGVAFGDNVKNVIFDGNMLTNCEYNIGKACRTMRMNNPVQSITAASDLSNLNLGYDCYLVTGTTAIRTLPDTVNGKMITFLFNSATPVETNGNIRLSAPFTATGGSSLTLMSFAHGWTEVGRAII